jgi:hypothetical protein
MKRDTIKLSEHQAQHATALMMDDPAKAATYIEACRRLVRLFGEEGILDSISDDDLKPELEAYLVRRFPKAAEVKAPEREKQHA